MKEQRNSKKNDSNDKISFVSIVTAIAFIALSLYFLSQTVRSVGIARQKLDVFDRAKEEVSDLRIQNIQLILLSERVETEEYIEEEARNRLNYAKDGETLFIIPDELLTDPQLDQYIGTFTYGYRHEGHWQQSNLQVWADFFLLGL